MTQPATTTEPSTDAPTVLDTVVLGDLLAARRSTAGLTLPKLAASSGISQDRIEAVEAGRHDLSDIELNRLLGAYPIKAKTGRFSGLVVEVSLDGQWVAMQRVRPSSAQRPAADRNLVTYLAMLYEDESLSLGAKVSLRSVDLSLLRPALAIRRDEVEVHLENLTSTFSSRLVKNRSLLAVAAAGVAAVAGALVLLPSVMAAGSTIVVSDSTISVLAQSSQTGVQAPAEPEIGTALIIERDATTASGRAQASNQGSTPTDPRIEIGTALVIERSPEAARESG